MSGYYHERPGVYSDYDASSISAVGSGRRVIALVGQAETAGLHTFYSYSEAKDVFAEDCELGKMLRLAYRNGAGTVLAYAVTADTETAYTAAFTAIFNERSAAFCAIASTRQDVQTALRDAVEDASAQRAECIGLAGMDTADATALCTRAQALNSERMVLLAPKVYLTGNDTAVCGGYAAAALAGVLADQSDPAAPLNGQVLQGFNGVTASYDDTQYDALAQAGLTVLECEGGKVSVVRALTTRTTSGGSADKTYRELSTMLILDDVIPALRTSLRSKFTRAKNNALTRKAIRNQVVIELEDRIERQIVESYDDLTVRAADDDRTTCIVEFTFSVVQGLNRIYLTAHVSV